MNIYNRWAKYEEEKKKLAEMNLPPEQYQRLIRQLLKELDL